MGKALKLLYPRRLPTGGSIATPQENGCCIRRPAEPNHELAAWIGSRPQDVDCLEITAEHFFQGGEGPLATLRHQFPLFVHGLGLSLGSPGPLDSQRLGQFARVVRSANPDWISEHIAFTRTAEADLGHLNPVLPTREMMKVIADHAMEVSERCQKPVLLENITSPIQLTGDLSKTDFLNQLCERADCGLLLDVTNLFIHSRKSLGRVP